MPEVKPNLPPAGHKRDEELKKREDNLAEAAEKHATAVGVEALNPDAFDPDREIQGHLFDNLHVENALPDYHYCWVNAENQHGYMVKQKLTMRRGWEVVRGDMPEAPDCRTADGTRRLGDVMLLRIKKELFAQLEAAEEKKRQLWERGRVTGALESMRMDLARKHGANLIHVDPDQMPEHVKAAVLKPGANDINGIRGVEAARQKLDTNLRNGTVAGLTP